MMTYKVQVQTANGSYWLSHDLHLGFEDTTKDQNKASIFRRELSLKDAMEFATLAGSKQPLVVINHLQE